MPGPESRRPRSSHLVGIDPNNLYAEIGVSPLATTEEIQQVIKGRRTKVNRDIQAMEGGEAKERLQQELARLNEVKTRLENAKNRAEYDRKNPQNVLLTVQVGPADSVSHPTRLGPLVSAWLADELPDAWLPTANTLAVWLPDREILALVAPDAAHAGATLGGLPALDLKDLDHG